MLQKPNFKSITLALQKLANPDKAKLLARFFKTGPGEYGEGDVFLGITVPAQKKVAGQYANLTLTNLQKLLQSKIHEHRLTALLILVKQYQQAGSDDQKQIVDFYLHNTKHINNWDLVDLSAPNILGNYLLKNDRRLLYQLMKSKNLWERRIAILATFAFIRNNQFTDTLKIAKLLLIDKHDLIHKALGWMLREIGKRDQKILEDFLNQHHQNMPRTMLRYAIERLPEALRKKYLHQPKILKN